MLGKLEFGRLDIGGNQEVLDSINAEVEKYYNALPAEARKPKGDIQRHLAILLKIKSAMLDGKTEEAMKTLNTLQPPAQGSQAGPPAEYDDAVQMLRFATDMMKAANMASSGQPGEDTLRKDVETLRKTPVEADTKFVIHLELPRNSAC